MQATPPFMRQALGLAARAVGVSDPNPRVGCVIVAADGHTVLGTGHTQPAGEAHAEAMALREAAAHGRSVEGATVWVTLEPCAHHGRTPPCCDALIAAKVGKVVAALPDPNPLVAGEGLQRLRAAGIAVETGPGEAEARDLNVGFFSRMQRGLPWVRMKIAASLDGRTALESGASQWITSEAARTDGHAWRARASAVLTGIGTVMEDDPRLDVRHVAVRRQPLAVIVDSRLETPTAAKMFIEGRPLLVYAAVPDAARRGSLEKAGATVVEMPGPNGKVDLAALLRDLARREVNEVHVEAGHKLNGSLLREGLVDELLVYLAPKLLGPGRDMANIGPLAQLSQALPLEFTSIEAIGPDLRIRALVKRP
ncbi:bifunctional diaminohydroxyphosphoribosylaminopyrimidine deaminase/5-amino-6-(5-phosphoribosylamino)uracil reductase RibD [Ramlibacter sp. PS4R-6]|uniref:bifunctional diaminohydroxyphosphoribosylaminopyrimidine deaminase/5-amino-6-(5-phosphoribosylamino)uracil reductase RibD n=1 Tax=Ramlibacter sp. PS4R-6 TaxID=3133438 RepID=UPI0030AA4EA5